MVRKYQYRYCFGKTSKVKLSNIGFLPRKCVAVSVEHVFFTSVLSLSLFRRTIEITAVAAAGRQYVENYYDGKGERLRY